MEFKRNFLEWYNANSNKLFIYRLALCLWCTLVFTIASVQSQLLYSGWLYHLALFAFMLLLMMSTAWLLDCFHAAKHANMPYSTIHDCSVDPDEVRGLAGEQL